jgi:fructokinase
VTDIAAIGEILVDLTQTGTAQGAGQFSAYPGGAPANVAVAASRLGARTAFIGKVGQDAFGRALRQALRNDRVSDRSLYETDRAPTTLAVVSVDEQGERSFSFYRSGCADTLLTEQEALLSLQDPPRILHFGSVSLTGEPSRCATLAAVRQARALGCTISYDPNYRAALWPDEPTARHWMAYPLELVDVLKVSEEELFLLSGCTRPEEGSQVLAERGIPLVLVTLGEQGSFYRLGTHTGRVGAVPTQVADTNGAGDAFLGAVLCRLARRAGPPLEALTAAQVESILLYANQAACLTCSRSGAIPALPTWEELEAHFGPQ